MLHEGYSVRFPGHYTDVFSLDQEYCIITNKNTNQSSTVKFHEYEKIFSIPGLYESICHDCLECYSPEKVCGLLRGALAGSRLDVSDLCVLDLGAGNGMVGEQLCRIGVETVYGIDIRREAKEGTDGVGRRARLNESGEQNFVLLDVEGKGHYVGCCLHIDTNEVGWWGEGDDMFFVDGEAWPPNIHGTGTEDYFCGAWNYHHLAQTFCTPYFGYHFKGNADYTGKHSQYRFHIEDPIYFEKSLRFSIEHGHANHRSDDYSSTAYWYQTEPHKPLWQMLPVEKRLPRD